MTSGRGSRQRRLRNGYALLQSTKSAARLSAQSSQLPSTSEQPTPPPSQSLHATAGHACATDSKPDGQRKQRQRELWSTRRPHCLRRSLPFGGISRKPASLRPMQRHMSTRLSISIAISLATLRLAAQFRAATPPPTGVTPTWFSNLTSRTLPPRSGARRHAPAPHMHIPMQLLRNDSLQQPLTIS